MDQGDDRSALLGRVLNLQQQNIDLRAQLDREHQAGEGFLRFSERALEQHDLPSFWALAAEELVSTFSTESALLVRIHGDSAEVCASCCADDVTCSELQALATIIRRLSPGRTLMVHADELVPVGSRPTAVQLIGTFRDRGDDGRVYAVVANVSAAKVLFYPTFDSTCVPLFATFVNHTAVLQQHISGRFAMRRDADRMRRLADVADRTSNAVVITGKDGLIEWVNDGFTRLTGWELSEVVGSRPGTFLQGPSTSQAARRAMREAVAANQGFDCEVLNYARSGRRYWVQIETRVTYDERGEPSGFVAIETDVTERRLAERRERLAQRIAACLLESGSLDRAAAQVVAELVGELDVRVAQMWVVEEPTAALRHVAGAAAADAGVEGQAFVDATRHRAFPKVRTPGLDFALPGSAWGAGRACVQPLPSTRATSGRGVEALNAGITTLSAAPILGPSGVLGVIEVGTTDTHPGAELLPAILERVAEQVASFMLHDNSRRTFQTIFEQSPDGLLLVDPEGRVLAANGRAESLFGDEANPELDRLLTDGTALMREALATYAAGQVPPLYHRDATGPHGQRFSAEVSVAATPTSSTQAAIIAVRDLTERHRMEQAVTQSLQEKETLLKEIHHRVKNNLQIISSLLQLQVDRVPSAEARGALEESVHRVRSMALIHQQLYGAASLERVDLAVYAEQLSEPLRRALAPNARLKLVAPSIEVTVEHAVPFGLILNELLTNAFKYGVPPGGSPDAPCDVTLTLEYDDGMLRLTVQDRGPGLPAGFDVAQGASLGLLLVRTLTRQLRGTFEAFNAGGACFRLSFRVRPSG